MAVEHERDDEQADTEEINREETTALLDRRRRNLPRDRHIESHTHLDEDGDKIHQVEYEKKSGDTETITENLTALLGAAPSTTSNLEVLVIEAQQAADADATGLERMNPHIPSNDEILADAIERIENKGLEPAWEVVDGTRGGGA